MLPVTAEVAEDRVDLPNDANKELQEADELACGDNCVAASETSAESAAEEDRLAKRAKSGGWKKNFSLKKQLIRADSKLRDLIVAAGRRGSAPSANSSKPNSPVDCEPRPTFPAAESNCCESAESCSSVEPKPVQQEMAESPTLTTEYTDAGGKSVTPATATAPVRPPRRNKHKRPPSATVTTEILTKWPSSDELVQVLDLRLDGGEDCRDGCTSGFLDNIVRKFSKSLISLSISP